MTMKFDSTFCHQLECLRLCHLLRHHRFSKMNMEIWTVPGALELCSILSLSRCLAIKFIGRTGPRTPCNLCIKTDPVFRVLLEKITFHQWICKFITEQDRSQVTYNKAVVYYIT